MSFLTPDAKAVCEFIRRELGIDYEDRWDQLERRLASRYAAVNCKDLHEYRTFLEEGHERAAEVSALGSLVTNNETYFFREPEQIFALVRDILPELQKQYGASHQLRLWSAACSSGEEPYSLAIALLDCGKISPERITIIATDLSLKALEIAKNGIYRASSLRVLEPSLVERYFEQRDQSYYLSERVKKIVQFAPLNLIDSKAIHSLGYFDVIFCRNVMMYFHRETQKQVLSSLMHALNHDGILMLGHADSLCELPKNFLTMTHHGAVMHKSDSALTSALVSRRDRA